MSVPAAYLTVVILWSTTPLGIVWSIETIHPTMAVLLRMVIALVLGLVMIKVGKINFPWHPQAVRLYITSAIGIVGGMLLSYIAAQYLSSGLMSLVFGLSPIASGILAQRLLSEARFTAAKKVALTTAVISLAIVCYDKIALSADSWVGICLIFAAMLFFSLSGVLIKAIKIEIHPIANTIGALTFATPVFALVWLLADGTVPIETWNERSILSVIYLGVFGSLLGFIAYFYILQKLAASTVALITLMTPAVAMTLGALLNMNKYLIS